MDMSSKFSLTGISDIALGKDLRSKDKIIGKKAGMTVLNSVSFFLAGVSVLFLVAFQINESVSLTWFFLSEALAFLLIPLLARQGFEKAAKILLIAYADIGIIILSSVFGGDAMIQAFFIPAMGLSILLFDNTQVHLRNMGILLSILSYFILDYIIFERISISESSFSLVRWSVLTGSFVTTWLIFNTFSQFKEDAEYQTLELLQKEQELNQELSLKQEKLENYIGQLEVATEELAKSTKAKSEFLATMSHEIRTPMNAILGMTHLLKQDSPRKDQIEPINILDFSGKTLLSLIDDVLDFSKIEAGKIEFENIEFELNKLVNVIVESFRVTAKNKSIELKTDIGDGIPNYLVGDPARLTQILNNLYSNALKFTEEGEVLLSVNVIEDFDDSVRLQFAISDTGIGIEKNRVDTIFESFTQASQNTKRLFGGTGLGLTISKQLTDLQGGSISVESEEGEGSTFYVELTFEKGSSEEEAKAITENFDSAKSLSGLKVLLAEDNLVNQKVMLRFLERWNVEMKVVDNGFEAVEAIKENNYDVVLMDLQMPKMDGYEASENIRKLDDPYKRKTPIIALTAAALKEVREKVYASGMNDFVTKPFNPADLEQKLFQFIEK
ncbi:MAG: hybrid sensor histidine kinase/response regulator [Balneola sp.]|nr:hybrid sensor histidine kinase/response regulator [Balneola sp.]MBE79017.1 hybrid sensor histidine kinase/response regulator [Balneola sp.]|tara:strand:- start:7733 stop:9571 length:1839 start_codon:yes stop_codon:yes gene_type:complete